MNLLVKASEDKSYFHFLIGKEVTFASDYIGISGAILHTKGEKAFISDVEYTPPYYNRFGHWIPAKINTIQINGIVSTCWLLSAFEKHPTINP